MGDGYFYKGVTYICTDNFAEQEVLKLVKILDEKFGIKSSINKRKKSNGNMA